MDAMPDVASVPEWLRTVIFIAGFIGGTLAFLVGYLRKGKAQPAEDLVITGASIADTRPMKDLVEEVRGLILVFREGVRALEDIRDIMRAEADEAEIERRAEERAEVKVQRILKRVRRG